MSRPYAREMRSNGEAVKRRSPSPSTASRAELRRVQGTSKGSRPTWTCWASCTQATDMRLYHDLEPDDPLMEEACSLACNNTNIDLCTLKNLPHPLLSKADDMFPMNWRFFPSLDFQVAEMGSRDLDSRWEECQFLNKDIR